MMNSRTWAGVAWSCMTSRWTRPSFVPTGVSFRDGIVRRRRIPCFGPGLCGQARAVAAAHRLPVRVRHAVFGAFFVLGLAAAALVVLLLFSRPAQASEPPAAEVTGAVPAGVDTSPAPEATLPRHGSKSVIRELAKSARQSTDLPPAASSPVASVASVASVTEPVTEPVAVPVASVNEPISQPVPEPVAAPAPDAVVNTGRVPTDALEP